MTQYIIEGNTVDTDNAVDSWADVLDKTETGYVSKYTGSGYHRATLYKSRRGRYYMTHSSTLAREPAWAEWLSPERAVVFFLRNKLEIPLDLQQYYARIRSVCDSANKKLEDLSAIEIAQHLADFVTDQCKHCPLWTQLVYSKAPGPCIVDANIIECLSADRPGHFAKHNYSTDKRYDPIDARHWKVAERMSQEEINAIFRSNA